MAQPKKLTHKQKQEKKLLNQIAPYKEDLVRIKRAMKEKPGEMETWRWACLEIFRKITNLKIDHIEATNMKEYALKLAAEAQGVINFST